MKFIVLVLILPLSSFAADWTKKSERDIYDLMYLPEEKTTYVLTDLNFPGNKTDKRVNGQKIASTETKAVGLDLQVGHTVMKNLSLELGVGYLFFSQTDYDDVTNGTYEENSKGLSDPTFTLRYRLLEQESHLINLDLIPSYTFKTGEREVATTSVDGNNKLGGSVIGATIQAGLKFSKLQFLAFLTYDQYAEAKMKDIGTTESRSNTEFGGQFQIHFAEKWLFDSLLSFGQMSEYTEDTSTTAYLDYPSKTYVKLAPQFTYLWDQNLALFAPWELSQAAKYTAEDQNGQDVDYGQIGYSRISLMARYQF